MQLASSVGLGCICDHNTGLFSLSVWTGDFFKDELPKADLYILARILHDWPDEKVNILLSKIADACTPGKFLQDISVLFVVFFNNNER